MIAVVTGFDREKSYALPDLLRSFAALQAPEGESLRFVLVVAGPLRRGQARQLQAFAAAHPAEVIRVPSVPRDMTVNGWQYWVAGELRERGLQALRETDDWYCGVDSDTLLPADALLRLRARVRALACGLSLTREGGHPIAAGNPDGPEPSEVEWAGFAGLLVRGDIARAISFAPFLEARDHAAGGDDMHFCREARRQFGEAVLLDPEVTPWHVDSTGLAVRARFDAAGRLDREVRATLASGIRRPVLVPRVDGYSHQFGLLRTGQPFWTDAQGRELTPAECEEYARNGQFLDLALPA